MGLLGDVTLIHKDFAKSTAWQLVAFCACICVVLSIALIAAPDTFYSAVWDFTRYTIGGMVAAVFATLGINMKKYNSIKKELRDET